MKIQVPFQQLLTLIRELTPAQKAKLKRELETESKEKLPKQDDFFEFLLSGPVYSDVDIAMIQENRKSIAAWRTKS